MKTMAEVLKLVKRKSFLGVWYQVCFKKNKNKAAPSPTVIPKHIGCQLQWFSHACHKACRRNAALHEPSSHTRVMKMLYHTPILQSKISK